jgi:hypothetical protein
MYRPTLGFVATKKREEVNAIGETGIPQAVRGMAVALAFFLVLISSPSRIAAQGETPSPSPSASPKTQEEIDLEQEIRLLTLKKQRDDLKKGIREDQPTPSPPPAPSTTPLEGKTTLDDNVFLEVEMVSHNAMSEAADRISTEIGSKMSKPAVIAIYNAKDIAAWRFYTSMFPAFKGQLNSLEHKYSDLGISLPTPTLTGLGPLAAVQTDLEAGANALRAFVDLIAIFRTDTDIKGKAVTIDESALVAELFRALKNTYKDNATLYYPAVFPPQLMDPNGKFIDSPTLSAIGKLFKLEGLAVDNIADLAKLKDDLAKDDTLNDEIKKNNKTIQDNSDQLSKLDDKLKTLRLQLKKTKPGSAKAARLGKQIKAVEDQKKTQTEENDKLTKETAKTTQQEARLKNEIGRLVTKLNSIIPNGAATKPDDIQAKIDELKALNGEFDKFTAGFVTINDTTGVNPLTLFIKAENLDAALKECLPTTITTQPGQPAVPRQCKTAYWLELKTLKAGGNNRTRKNLIRYFSGAKVDHSGGVIVEYTLYDKSGAVVYSDKYSFYNGYVDPKGIRDLQDKVAP